jgi:transcription-repair coupling factor (superfamily II helicase)
MRDLEIRGAGNLLGHDQSGPVAAVGYDLYVQLVAEAVAEAKGVVAPEVVTITLDVPGEAHLPKDYVEADDARLEAYRRLANVADRTELDDLRLEWVDRYGALPGPARGLLDLADLRLRCLAHGVSTLQVLAAKVGVRSQPVVRLSPLELSLSTQMRVRRRYGSRAYNDETKEFRCEIPGVTTPALVALVEELFADTTTSS